MMLNPGDSFGDYRVIRLLGKGGMGSVYLLENDEGVQVAAKILDPESAGDGESRKRFLREAQLALGVKHPNLVETYDVGEDPETGLCYILMEYVPGGSLADKLRNGPLSVNDAIRIVYQIASVLELARQKGIVHRDIKPDNIMFGVDGKAKLADLGIARGGVGGVGVTTVTQTGMMIGTPAYMSPEQMMDAHNVDCRADIYSLGIVFYEMLAGKRPNADDTVVQLMAKAVAGEPIPDVRTLRPEVSASVAELINLMCAMKADERVATPVEVTTALSQIVHGREVTIRRKAPKTVALSGQAGRSARLPGVRAFVPLLILGGLMAAGAWFYVRHHSRQAAHLHVVRTNVVERTVVVTNAVENRVTVVQAVTNAAVAVVPLAGPRPVEEKKTVSVVPRVRPASVTLDFGQGEKLEFVGCPADRFLMGHPHEKEASLYDPHQVTFTRPFWIARYQLTWRQWRILTGRTRDLTKAEQILGGESCPVTRVPRAEVDALCRDLTERFAAALPTGTVVRLPTYAEWEYAACAGDEDPQDPHSLVHRHRPGSRGAYGQIACGTDDRYRILAAAGHDTFPSEAAFRDVGRRKWKEGLRLSAQEESWMRDVHFPTSVGRKRPNVWGVYDAYGNGHEELLDTVDITGASRFSRGEISWEGLERDPLLVGTSKRVATTAALDQAGKLYSEVRKESYAIRLVIGPGDFNGGRTTLADSARSRAAGDAARDREAPTPTRVRPPVPALKGKTFQLQKRTNLEMIGCPAGTFQMGDPWAPARMQVLQVHEVTITRPFWICKHPVTRAQWSTLMGKVTVDDIDQTLGGMNAPVSKVSVADIREFCQQLTRRFRRSLPKGYVFRLPTDAEWEYAARGGSSDPDDPYVSDRMPEDVRRTIAVFSEDKQERLAKAGFADVDPRRVRFAPFEVCTKKPNGWGIYDMAGNVDELILDTLPSVDANGSVRRGGSEVMELDYLAQEKDPLRRVEKSEAVAMFRYGGDGRTGRRKTLGLSGRHEAVGFRVVLGPDLESERKHPNGSGKRRR